MADDEQPAPEQGGGSTPPPALGVPGLGVPGLPPADRPGTDPGVPPSGRPEVVEGYPYAGSPQRAPRSRRALTISRVIVIGFVLLAGVGWVVTQVRHAHATPEDKTACASTLTALNTPATGIPVMMHDLEFANDKTLLGARGNMTTHIQQQNLQGLDADLNTVIHRCNQLSDSFKTGFQSFCDNHPGYCKQTFHIGPF